jgi:predicted DNA binding protein
MWILKLKLNAENFLMGKLAKKFNVDILGYPLSYYKDFKNLFLTSAGYLIGESANKKNLISYARRSKEFVNIEIKNDFIINVSKQPLETELVYNSKLIRPNPVYISKEGYHIWEIASWERDDLELIINITKRKYQSKILKFKKEKISNISFTSILPELSVKQKQAIDLAISEGYYKYPKKTNLHKLAKLSKLSYSTYQEHLKKAESKLMPNINRL